MPSHVTYLPEKFRRYECSDCQVCPFNPQTEQRPLPALILWYFLGSLLALIRLGLLVIVAVFLLIFEALAWLLSCIPSLRNFIRYFGVSLPCRLVLFLLGVVSVSALNVNVPGQQKVKLPARAFASVKVGSLVISNLLSIAEILYFEYSFSPVYAVPSSSETSGASLSKLQELACRMRQPVLLFAEGFATNGKALLPFADVVQDTSLCICAVVSVEGWRWKPVRTVEGGWTYFLSLLVQPKLSLVVKCIPEECLAFLDQCSDASQRANMIRESMAKVGSLNLIKQFSKAQGDDRQPWVYASTKSLRAQFQYEWIEHFDKMKKK